MPRGNAHRCAQTPQGNRPDDICCGTVASPRILKPQRLSLGDRLRSEGQALVSYASILGTYWMSS